MRNQTTTRSFLRATLAAVSLCAFLNPTDASAQQDSMFSSESEAGDGIQGYTEPFRSIELSSDETGAISELTVQEGDFVQKDQIVATLDDRVQKIQMESAKHLAESRGRYHAAEQTLAKRQKMFDLISELQKTGGTSHSEIVRANMELLIAEAKFSEAKEEVVERELDLKRAEVQLERRWIRAPFAGIVAKVHREDGEFLSPLHPEIITLVKIDVMLAVFNLPSQRHNSIEVGRHVIVILSDGRSMEGTVHAIGVETDAKSGTIPVKVKLNNSDSTLRSGEQCVLNI